MPGEDSHFVTTGNRIGSRGQRHALLTALTLDAYNDIGASARRQNVPSPPALAREKPPLRLPVGSDAELVATSRASMSYDDFPAAMSQGLQIDW